MAQMIEDEIGKYRSKKESNVSKSKKKSDHKHSYEECLIQYDYEFLGKSHKRVCLSSYCTICGKIGGKKKNTIVSDYTRVNYMNNGLKYYSTIPDDELLSEYKDKMPLFEVHDIFIEYLSLTKNESEKNNEN